MKIKNNKKVISIIGGILILTVVGTVGALNGWFGGGANIPEDTMTRGLVGYWSFDESSGPLVFDKSNEGNNGMINDGGSGNPVAYWMFDEGSGSTVYDYIGSNNGTLTNSPTWTSFGKVDGALQFDGVNDSVDFGNSADFVNPTNKRSVFLWIKGDVQGEQSIFTHWSDAGVLNQRGWRIMKDVNTDKFRVLITDDGGWTAGHKMDYISSIIAVDNSWHYIGFTFDAGALKLFVDGVEDPNPNKNIDDAITTIHSPTVGVLMGAGSSPPGNFSKVDIDEARIYNYVRTPDDIMKDYLKTYNTKFVDGKVGGALEFDGVDDYVDVGNVGVPQNGPATIEGWYYFTQFAATKGEGVPLNNVLIQNVANNHIYLEYPASADYFAVASALTLNTWHHIVLTYSGDTSSAKLYVDSNVYNINLQAGADNIAALTSFRIGRDSTALDYFFNGSIDEVRVYNRVLSIEEIKYHYNRGGPVVHWKFDEGNGTTTYDSTWNNNDGQFATAENSPSWVSGKYGTALQFDGENDLVEVSNDVSSIIGQGSHSFSVWTKFTATNQGGLVNYYTTTGSGYSILYEINGNIGFTSYANAAPNYNITTPLTYNDGKWHHIVAVRNKEQNSSAIYIDGIKVISSIAGYDLPAGIASLRIGLDGWGGYFNGLIDDVRIYNYARTADEIRLDYNAGLAVKFGDPEFDMTRGLIGYWSMDEGNGNFVYDQSDYNNTGYVRPEGKALQFDGVNNYVNAGADSSLDFVSANAFTVEFWMKPFDTDTYQTPIGKENGCGGDDTGWTTQITDSGSNFEINIDYGDGTNWDSTNVNNIKVHPYGSWYHVVGIMDSNNLYIYVDTVLDGTDPRTYIFTDAPVNLAIGTYALIGGCGGRSFKGLINEVKIYNRALSATEIAEHHKGIFSDETGLVGYWPLDEGYGTVAHDESGKGNSGILTNGPVWKNNMPRWTEGAPSPSVSSGSSGSALRFDGVDDYVSVGDLGDFTSQGTIEFWMNPSSVDSWRNPFTTNYNGSNVGIRFEGGPAGTFGVIVGDDTGDYGGTSCTYFTTELTENTWYHVIFIWDTDSSLMSGYINGVQKCNMSHVNWPTTLPAVTIGQGFGSDRHWNGLIDEVRIYDRALSVEEVRYHYNRGDPVAHWKFDEGLGTTTYDGTNNNNDGTLGGGATVNVPTWVAGKYGSALSFDGVNDYVGMPYDSSLQITQTITVEAWVNLGSYTMGGSSSDRGTIITKADNYYFTIEAATGKFAFILLGTSGTHDTSNTAVPLNQWTHLVVTYDGKNARWYMNGVLDKTKPLGGTVTTGTAVASIGAQLPTVSRVLNSKIDDVRIYNYARTADEIRLDYNQGLAGRFAPTDAGCDKDPAGCINNGLVGYWNMDEGSGATSTDGSGYGNNGILTNNPAWTVGVAPLAGGSGGGGALEFDGIDDYVDFGNPSSLDITSAPMSVLVWVKPTQNAANGYILAKNTSALSDVQYSVFFQTPDQITIHMEGAVRVTTSAGTLPLNSWTLVGWTWDGTTIQPYINGVADVNTGTYSGSLTSRDYFLLGRRAPNVGIFTGLIDDVRIYSRALSAEEIRYHYNRGGPVAHWAFDEGSGTTTYDGTNNNNDGQFMTATSSPAWVQGKYGSALLFDGENDYVIKTSFTGQPTGNEARTIAAWVNPSVDLSGNNVITFFGTDSAQPYGYGVYIDSSYKVRVEFDSSNGLVVSNKTLSSNEWHHVVVTYDGLISTIYVDGLFDNSVSYLLADTQVGNVYIGTWGSLASYFNGLIDEVRIYNYVRTQEQILQDYNGGVGTHF